MERDKRASQVALKWGIASAVALGALASGFLMSRRGRRFVSDVWHEKRRTPLEDRVIDTIWGEAVLGKRPIDVAEVEPGVIAVLGQVRSNDERRALLTIASSIKGVKEVEDKLEVVPARKRKRIS
jgi:osmotically-inducible protein OsmY